VEEEITARTALALRCG